MKNDKKKTKKRLKVFYCKVLKRQKDISLYTMTKIHFCKGKFSSTTHRLRGKKSLQSREWQQILLARWQKGEQASDYPVNGIRLQQRLCRTGIFAVSPNSALKVYFGVQEWNR